jgi:HSP20 family protein
MVKIYIRTFSHKFKNLREEKKLTQEELAERLGISRQSVISVERGKNLPSLPLALRIAEIFEQSFDELFFGKVNKNERKEGEKIMPRGLLPFSPLGDMDRFFDDEEMPQARLRHRALAVPPVNVKQTEKDVILTADIPGVQEEDLNIEVGEDFVDIAGVRKEELEEENEGYYRKEVNYGSFSRRIPLPAAVDADQAEAKIKDGQLQITIAKLEPAKPKVTKIKIKKAE